MLEIENAHEGFFWPQEGPSEPNRVRVSADVKIKLYFGLGRSTLLRQVLETELQQSKRFLVGKNGSGKSNLVDVFAFLSECMSLPLHTVFENRGGINAVRYRSGTKSRPGNFAVRVEFISPMRTRFQVGMRSRFGRRKTTRFRCCESSALCPHMQSITGSSDKVRISKPTSRACSRL